ncbi:response regulator transcription factor [Corynebacterium durum]|jgi:luxR family response regulator|uniref:response regulator transcription factor n=1 Tax=Corynebacterium durum TaxID=61592 RepID=UPI0015CBF01B|nr:response regulator transcription factor [Corynebacterium durum]NYI72861.1 DNA-binding NarL/FixJ family response regulator [Corynebacterium durum]WJY84590.1 Transcriptional regulatory protein DegU [Corynebacterium durum]
MIRVLIVDDQQLLRRGLKLLLAQSPEIQVVTTCASAAETLVSLHNSEVDVVLADAVMPGMDGPELVEQCHTLWPSLPVIILTTFDDATIVRRSIKAGAAGFLLKDVSPTTLAEAITAAYDGHPYVDPRVAHLLALPSRFAGLTPTEKTVAELVGQGLSNREIAAELHLAEGTVKNHISALLRKTQVPDRTRLALHFHT